MVLVLVLVLVLFVMLVPVARPAARVRIVRAVDRALESNRIVSRSNRLRLTRLFEEGHRPLGSSTQRRRGRHDSDLRRSHSRQIVHKPARY